MNSVWVKVETLGLSEVNKVFMRGGERLWVVNNDALVDNPCNAKESLTLYDFFFFLFIFCLI